MNVQLKEVTVTRRDGRITQLDQIFIRGSHCRWIIIPDMLKNAPMFKKIGSIPKAPTIGVRRGRPSSRIGTSKLIYSSRPCNDPKKVKKLKNLKISQQ